MKIYLIARFIRGIRMYAATDIDYKDFVDDFTIKFPDEDSARKWLEQYPEIFDGKDKVIEVELLE